MSTALNGELISYTEQQTKGEVDTQIATAKRFPRSVKQFKERALSYATLDDDTASSCFYTLPARRGGDGKAIEGPSARLAEIVAASYGNLRAQACIVDDDGTFITAQGRCWDLENNVAIAVDVRRRITDRNNNRYSADMINTTANAACSIALRNSVFKVVPMALVKPVYEAARKVAIGDATTLVKRRADMIAYFKKMTVTESQLLAAVSRASVEDITVDDLATLKGLATAIKDGDTTVDECFPLVSHGTADSKEPDKTTASEKLADSLPTADKSGKAKPKAEPEPVREPGDEPETKADPTFDSFQQRIMNAVNPTAIKRVLAEAARSVPDYIDQQQLDQLSVLGQEVGGKL